MCRSLLFAAVLACTLVLFAPSASGKSPTAAECKIVSKFVHLIAFDVSSLRLSEMEANRKAKSPETAETAMATIQAARKSGSTDLDTGSPDVLRMAAKAPEFRTALKSLITEARLLFAGDRSDIDRAVGNAELELSIVCPE